jgi:hypothetical protein
VDGSAGAPQLGKEVAESQTKCRHYVDRSWIDAANEKKDRSDSVVNL